MKLTLEDLIDLTKAIAISKKDGYLIIKGSSKGWQVMVGCPGFKVEEYLNLVGSCALLKDALIAKIKDYTTRIKK